PRRTCPWVSRMPSASPPTLSMRSRLRSVEASWDGEEASLTPAPNRAECGGKQALRRFDRRVPCPPARRLRSPAQFTPIDTAEIGHISFDWVDGRTSYL